jgi:AraC-like DNA-binding protein
MTKISANKTVPVIIASMAKPFADALKLNGRDPSPLLKSFDINANWFVDEKAYIPAQVWYDFAEAAADQLNDGCLGFRIGYEADLNQLPNLKPIQFDNVALGEIITALIIDSRRLLTLSNYNLSIGSHVAQINSTRTFSPTSPPNQIDGYFAGFIYRIFRIYISKPWKREDLLITVCEPSAIPADVHNVSIIQKGDLTGANFRFPTDWLLAHLNSASPNAQTGKNPLQKDFLKRLRSIMGLRLFDPNLSIDWIASQTSQSTRQLQSQLSKLGTNYTSELRFLRTEAACRILSEHDVEIAAVGEAVGIPTASVFSRAFKLWTGLSPRQYRKEICLINDKR